MSPDETNQPATEKKPERRFRVKLVQHVWRVTEQFDEIGGEVLTGNKKQALAKVQAFVDDEKDLEDVEYKLEVEEITEDTSSAKPRPEQAE